jgi:hypothetical protein
MNKRRPLDDDNPTGYQESDKDYVLNNIDLCVKLLDERAVSNDRIEFCKKEVARAAVGWHKIYSRESNRFFPAFHTRDAGFTKADEAAARKVLALATENLRIAMEARERGWTD